MANKYWVGGSGNFSDNTNHWADSSGGAAGATIPAVTDNVFFDSNSHNDSYTVTMDANDVVTNATFSAPSSGDLTLTMNAILIMRGDVALYSGMTIDGASNVLLDPNAGQTLTMNGCTPSAPFLIQGVGGTTTLQDEFNSSGGLRLALGTLDTNDQIVTCSAFTNSGTGIRVLDLGASTVNSTTFNWPDTTNLTFDAGTSTINLSISLNCGSTGGNSQTFNVVNFTGASARDWKGSNTFGTVGSDTTSKTITVADGTTQTITTWGINGNEAGNVTFVSATPGTSYEIAVGAGTVDMSFCDITDCEATGGAKFLGGENGGGNTGFYRFKSDARQLLTI